jgi:hypothetical protein
VVERSPEKAGVGGSTPSRGTIESTTYTHSKDNSVTTCHKINSGVAEVCLNFGSGASKLRGLIPQLPRNQNSCEIDSNKDEDFNGGGA